MKKKLRIGLCGFGSMGKVHAFCVQNLPYFYKELPFEAEIAGVCTTNPAKAEQIAREYGFSSAAASEDELIADPDIDIIDICTPNLFHYDTVRRALAAKKHIYCEKPLCVTAAQAQELATLAGESGLICNVVFNNRHLAPVMRAKELVEEGRIGRVLSFSAEYLHNSCTDPERPAGWKQNRDVCGGGVLFDLGSHALDLIYSLCGEFSSVSGKAQIAYPHRTGTDGQPWDTNADEAFYMILTLKNGGGVGTVSVSKLVNGANDDLSFSVYGERGCLKFSLMQPNYLYFYDATQPIGTLGGESGYRAVECVGRYPLPGGTFPSPKAPTGWLRGHVGSMYSFLNSVATGVQKSPDFADGAYIQKVMEAAYLSAREHKEITL